METNVLKLLSDREMSELKEIILEVIAEEKQESAEVVFQLTRQQIERLLDDRRYILSDEETKEVISLYCDIWENSMCATADTVIWHRHKKGADCDSQNRSENG